MRSPDSVGAGISLPSCSKGHCARPPYFSPKRGMPHLSCLPYQLAGWDVDYPAPSVPHASPTPRRQAQRYASPPGEEPGRGYSAGVGIQHGRLKSLPRTGREKNTCHGAHARFVCRRAVERTLSDKNCAACRLCTIMQLSLPRKIGITSTRASTGTPPQSRHLPAWRAKLSVPAARVHSLRSREFKPAFAQFAQTLG